MGGRDSGGGKGFWPAATTVSPGREGSQPALDSPAKETPSVVRGAHPCHHRLLVMPREDPGVAMATLYLQQWSSLCLPDHPGHPSGGWGSPGSCPDVASSRRTERGSPPPHKGPPRPWEDTAGTSLILRPPHATKVGWLPDVLLGSVSRRKLRPPPCWAGHDARTSCPAPWEQVRGGFSVFDMEGNVLTLDPKIK